MINRLIRLIFCFSLLSFNVNIKADSLTVVYPDVNAPYDTIYEQIKQGIDSEFKGDITYLKLPSKFDPNEIASSIKNDKVIALGKRGWVIAKKIYQSTPVVVGALPIRPNGISGVSLMTAPESLFQSLINLAPNVKKITVLYTPTTEWSIKNAQQDAKLKGLELVAIKVKNIQQAVKTYDQLFEGDDLSNQAIWLPLDPVTAHDKVIVPVILEKAWKNKMVVFSSKPTHAQRGALFSALPNNEQLGHKLVKMILNISKTKETIVTPLLDIELAVNLRTAAHLGFDYGNNQKSGFALTFPN